MTETIERIKSHEVCDEKFQTKDRRPTSTPGKRKAGTGDLFEPTTKPKSKVSKASTNIVSTENETYRTLQALLLAVSVLVLSYHGLRYGRTEYSILENGQIVNGFVSVRRAVITFSLGYSVFYSFISSLAAAMLLYSLASVSSLFTYIWHESSLGKLFESLMIVLIIATLVKELSYGGCTGSGHCIFSSLSLLFYSMNPFINNA